MKSLAIPAFCAAACLLAPVEAKAETYCRTGYFTKVYDGGEFTISWSVTAEGARKGLPGKAPSRWCSLRASFAGGAHRPPEIIAKPSRGQLAIRNKSAIAYRSNSPGADRFTLRVHWISGTKPASAIVNFNVTVHPGPL